MLVDRGGRCCPRPATRAPVVAWRHGVDAPPELVLSGVGARRRTHLPRRTQSSCCSSCVTCCLARSQAAASPSPAASPAAIAEESAQPVPRRVALTRGARSQRGGACLAS